MAQTFKPKSDKLTNGFINELGSTAPLWSSVDEGLTVPTDSDFIEIANDFDSLADDTEVQAFINFNSSQGNFNKGRLISVLGKIRIDTLTIDASVSIKMFDNNLVNLIAYGRQTINTASGFEDFIIDLKINTTDIDNWDLGNIVIQIAVGNVALSTTPTQLSDMQVSVFEVEVVTLDDCIVERLPQADGEFFTPSTWENELNVNHLLWESVENSGDARFVKALDASASGDILFEYQGVGTIPLSGIFRFRAKNNGTDDSGLDGIFVHDNLTHSIVGSGLLPHILLSGVYNTYDAPLSFLQSDFNPSSLYTVGTDISATGVLGIADTEISTQRLTLYMPKSYCCITNNSEIITTVVKAIKVTNSDIDVHNKSLFVTLPGDVADNYFQFIDPVESFQNSVGYRDSLFSGSAPPKFTTSPIIPDYNFYIQIPRFVRRPDIITLVFSLKVNNHQDFVDTTKDHINITLTDHFINNNITNPAAPEHIVEQLNTISTNFDNTYVTYTVNFDISFMTDAQFDSFNNNPLFGFVAWNSSGTASLGDMEIAVVKIIFTETINNRTCNQFSYPVSDLAVFTDGVWKDNVGNAFANRWSVVDEGVSTFNDNNHITYPSQVGQLNFPRIGFGLDQITIDPTSMKLNFRGGGIVPSGSVAHAMTFAAVYDTNGLIVANNGSTPIASLSGDLRSYTVDMNIVQGNRSSWDLSRPTLEMKFFVDTDVKDLRFSAVEIESCGICPDRDTGNITLVLENLEDCTPESVLRPNEDISIQTSGEWTFCDEFLDNCILSNNSLGGDVVIGGAFNPPITPTTPELQWSSPNNILTQVSETSIVKTYVVGVNTLESQSSESLRLSGFDFELPFNVTTITGLKLSVARRGTILDNITQLQIGPSTMSLLENGVFLIQGSNTISSNKFNIFNENINDVITVTTSNIDSSVSFVHWNDEETIVTYGSLCGTKNNNDNYWGVELTPTIVNGSNFGISYEVLSTLQTNALQGDVLSTITANINYIKLQLSYLTSDGVGGIAESFAWPCVDDDVTDVTDIDTIKMRSTGENRPTTIYWTEKGFGASGPHDVPQTQDMAIKSSNMNGDNVVTILQSPEVESPDNLVVDWVHDYLYFTESGSVVLQRCDLDGGNLIPICNLTDLTVEDTFIDFDEKRLYFSTANSGTIEYLNLPSGGIPQNWATGFNHPVGLWKYQSEMYVTDVEDDTLYSTTGGASKTTIVTGLNTPSGLVGSACEGVVFISNFASNGDITRISISNPSPLIIANSTLPHDLALDSRNNLLYFTELGDTSPFVASTGNIKRVQTNGAGLTTLLSNRELPHKLSIDTTDVETHTSTLKFGLTDLSRCCLGPTSGYVSVKGAELSTSASIDSFAYIKAKILNPSGDILWSAKDEPAKIEDDNGAIQIDTIGFNNQATNPDFANRAEWADAILQLDIEQFLQPVQPTGFGCPQLNPAFDLYAAQFNVTACSGIDNNDNITLFIDGSGDLSEVITLYTRSGFVDSAPDPLTLFLENKALPSSGTINLFIEPFGDTLNDNITLFVETLLPQSGDTDLFILSFLETSGTMNLVVSGSIGPSITDTMNLFLSQKDIAPSGQLSLFITTGVMNSGDFTLFTNAVVTHSGEINLFTNAADGSLTTDLFLENKQINDNMNLFLLGPDGQFSNNNVKLMVHGATISGQFASTPLFMEVDTAFNDNMILFIDGPGFNELTSNINLFIGGFGAKGGPQLFISNDRTLDTGNKTLFIDGPTSSSHSGNMNLFMSRENDSIASFHPNLFIVAPTPINDNTELSISGGQDITNNITLFHKGAAIPDSGIQELYVHGF